MASANSNGDEAASFDELYSINLVPSELFLKFRKAIEGFRVGFNLEFYNFQGNEYQAKLVLKPLAPDRKWRFIYEPLHGDIRLLSQKIPLTKYLNLQVMGTEGKSFKANFWQAPYPSIDINFLLTCLKVGIGHNFHLNAIGWKWKLSTCLGGDGLSQIQNKTSVGLFPGFDLRIGWRAEYILPEIHGAVGTGEPIFNMNYGRLRASLDRVEAIITHTNDRCLLEATQEKASNGEEKDIIKVDG